MIKLNKHGLISKRLIAQEFAIGNQVLIEEGGGDWVTPIILNLSKEQVRILSHVASADGKNIEVREDGTFDTTIGHTYCVTCDSGVTVWDRHGKYITRRNEAGQIDFVAITNISKITPADCTVTEVFRGAALMERFDWSGEEILPVGYKRVEWLKSSIYADNYSWGSTYMLIPIEYDQINGTIDVETEITIEPHPKVTTHHYQEGIDSGENWVGSWAYGIFYSNTQAQCVRNRYDSAKLTFFNEEKFNEWLHFKLSTNKNTLYGSLNGIQKQTTVTNMTEYTHKKFGLWCVTGVHVYSHQFLGKRKYFKMWINGEMKYHMVPALDPTGAPCMFNLIDQTPYYNLGSFDFSYPVEETTASTYSLRNSIPDWGKLTKHGLRRLYRVPEGYEGELYDYAIENGFKQIVETEAPEDGLWNSQWRETEDEIILDWIEVKETEE